MTVSQAVSNGSAILGGLGAICGSTNGTFLILMVPLGFLYVKVPLLITTLY